MSFQSFYASLASNLEQAKVDWKEQHAPKMCIGSVVCFFFSPRNFKTSPSIILDVQVF